MHQFVCPRCHVMVGPTAVFVSAGTSYWCSLPGQTARYEATCHHKDGRTGIHGCRFMRLALDAWLIDGSGGIPGDGGSECSEFDGTPAGQTPSPPGREASPGSLGDGERQWPELGRQATPSGQPRGAEISGTMERQVASSPETAGLSAAGPIASFRLKLSPDQNSAQYARIVTPLDADSPDFISPGSPSIPVSGDTGTRPAEPSLRDIMARFQSLGDNCEFGLVQRWAEAEPLDLLRFAGLFIPVEHRLRQMTDALAAGFSGLGEDPATVDCELQGDVRPRPYMVHETRWNLRYHIDEDEGTIDPAEVHRQQVVSLRFRRRKLLDDLRESHRVFVWKSNVPTREADVRELVACLKRHGPNMLLWVDVAAGEHRAGSVEYAGDGLLRGYVTRFAPYDDATDIEASSWYEMCCNAWAVAEILGRQGEWGHVPSRR